MIPIYQPWLTELEREYALKAIDSGWISSRGEFIEQFEDAFAKYVGTKYAVATNTGTAACHLAVLCSEVGDGEVLVPNLTYVATPNSVVQAGATPVFCDVNEFTWNMETDIEDMIGPKTRAIFAVHLFGNPISHVFLDHITKKHNLILIEDACESLGGGYYDDVKGFVKTGNWGLCAAFSLFANKTATIGEGGMLVTNDENVYKKAVKYRGQGHISDYYHDVIGFNYRMTNIAAAIGCAQMQRIEEIQARKKYIWDKYQEYLPYELTQFVHFAHRHSHWMFGINAGNAASIRAKLALDGIDSRPMFVPMTDLPPYKNHKGPSTQVYKDLYRSVLILPSYPQLTDEQIEYICDKTKKHLDEEYNGQEQ